MSHNLPSILRELVTASKSGELAWSEQYEDYYSALWNANGVFALQREPEYVAVAYMSRRGDFVFRVDTVGNPELRDEIEALAEIVESWAKVRTASATSALAEAIGA